MKQKECGSVLWDRKEVTLWDRKIRVQYEKKLFTGSCSLIQTPQKSRGYTVRQKDRCTYVCVLNCTVPALLLFCDTQSECGSKEEGQDEFKVMS